MSRLPRILAAFLLVTLPACGDGSKTPDTPAAPVAAAPVLPEGPLGYADIIGSPAASAGRTVELPISLVAGDSMSVEGQISIAAGQGWTDKAGKEHAIAPPPGFVVGPTCIFVVIGDGKTPVFPLQPFVVDKLQPCYAESSFSSVKLLGTVGEVRDVQLVVDGQPATLKAPVLTSVDWKSPL